MRKGFNLLLTFSFGVFIGVISNFVHKRFFKYIVYFTSKLNTLIPTNLLENVLRNTTSLTTKNETCVGVDSPEAGFADSCAGCPNASICKSGQAKKDTIVQEIENLSRIKNIVLILSGKGGVGKSTLSAQLSWYFSSQNLNVGLLDIDICGPSAPKMMGVQNNDVHISTNGWSPVYVNDYLSVMSTAFLLPESDDAVIWRGPKKNGLIKQFLTDVVWGELDFLIIDTPPGTSDEHLSIVSYLKGSNVRGAIIVTTPQEIALQDVRKEITFCKKVELNILGVVENMGRIFKNAECTASVKEMCEKMQVRYLTKIPWDEELLYACDRGVSIYESHPQSLSSIEIKNLGDTIIDKCS